MKRGILLVVIATAMLMTANAQGVRFGIKGGVNISSLADYEFSLSYEDAELGEKVGAYAGVFTQILFTPQLGLETGLYYSMLGGRDKENDYGEQYKITADPAYLQLPVSVIYKFNITEDFALYPSVGLYTGYGVSGKIKSVGSIGVVDVSSEYDYFDNYAKRFDFGGTMGANLQYKNVVLGFACDRSFTRVNEKKIVFGDNAFNSNFRITLGYIF